MRERGCIILGGHVQALGILRIFGRMGLPCIIIDNTRKNLSRHSVFCRYFYKVPDSDLLLFLLELKERREYTNWIIFPTNDFHVQLLSRNKQELISHFLIATDKWETIKIFYNKINTYRLAQQSNVPIAKTFFPTDENDLANWDITFPCIIKPAVMHEFYRKTKQKVIVCNNLEELRINYLKVIKLIPRDEVIVQDIIPGSGQHQYSVGILFLDGSSISSLTACRLRQHPLDFGNATTYAETVEVPLLEEYARKLLKAADYNGICEVEFKYDERDRQFKLLEVNPRTWKWHAISNKSNTPFLKEYFHYLSGLKVTSVYDYQPASFCHSITDLPVRLHLLFKGSSLWKRKRKPVENAVWDSQDFRPWFFEKIYLIHFLFNR